MKQYTTVTIFGRGEKARIDFDQKINEMISQGWEPIGGVNIICFESEYEYSQAMIRETDKADMITG